jgi:hypothetical protein
MGKIETTVTLHFSAVIGGNTGEGSKEARKQGRKYWRTNWSGPIFYGMTHQLGLIISTFKLQHPKSSARSVSSLSVVSIGDFSPQKSPENGRNVLSSLCDLERLSTLGCEKISQMRHL